LRKHYTLVGAVGAAALTVGALSAPALAVGEDSATVHYTCGTPAGPGTADVVYAINQAPASIVAGKTVSLPTTATFTLDAQTTGLATGLFGWVQFNGKLTTAPSATRAGLNMSIPKTTMGTGTGGTTVAPASGNTLVRAFKAGTYTMTLGGFDKVHLQGFDAQGAPLATNGAVDFPTPGTQFTKCTAPATIVQDATPANVTINVTKDTSTTKTKASYSANKDKATGTAKVKGKFGLPGSGKVKFTLKKGTKTIASKLGKLSGKGVASVVFKDVKKAGKYSITAKFSGDAALKGSSGKDTFTVK
jgi:hypothetical protein